MASLLDQIVVLLVVVVQQVVLRGVGVGFAALLQFAFLNELLFSLGSGSFLPLPGVGLPVHDDPLGLGHCPMVA